MADYEDVKIGNVYQDVANNTGLWFVWDKDDELKRIGITPCGIEDNGQTAICGSITPTIYSIIRRVRRMAAHNTNGQ